MKYIILLFLLASIFTALTMNFEYTVYAQDSNVNNVSSGKQNNIISSSSSSLSSSDTQKSFNIAVASDWGCDENAKITSQNIQAKDPKLVIAGGDLSYKGSGNCWINIISPFESKLLISMGDHEYHDTSGGKEGVVTDYLKPLDIQKTYYSYDIENVHITIIDPYIDYTPTSDQYQFIENDLKTASKNPNVDWIFVVEHIPFYTSPSKHPADTSIRDTYHPLFDKYNVDLVFSGDNHNYQRSFPLEYNKADSSNPIISDKNPNKYGDYSGVIYIITGSAGRSHYAINQQSPFIASQDDNHFGFLNLEIKPDKTLTATFNANEEEIDEAKKNNDMQTNKRESLATYSQNSILDSFTISK